MAEPDKREQNKLQAMFGGSKQQEAKYVLNQSGQKEVFGEESHRPQATILIKDCTNCEYTIDSHCTKVLVEGCNNCTLHLKAKIITAVIEIFRCHDLNINADTKVGTLQVDMCKNFTAQFTKKELFTSMVWAGTHDYSLTFTDSDQSLKSGFSQRQVEFPDLHEERDQFIVRFVKDKLLEERVIRTENGFPTTAREHKDWEDRREENLQKLAKEAGITIGRKKKEVKAKPNEPCVCGSGKKYKKCCGKAA